VSNRKAYQCDGKPECYDLSDECGGVCDTEQEFCRFQKFFLNSSSLVYTCENNYTLTSEDICDGKWSPCQPRVSFEESQCDGRHFCNATGLISIDKAFVCNGYFDCNDFSDESFCPNRFNCTTGTNPSSVPSTFTFDDFSDCADSSDECPPKLDSDMISSRNEMISSVFLRVWLWIMATVAIFGNGYVIVKTISRKNKLIKSSIVSKMNHFLIFNLAISDFLMGLYLIIIAVYSVLFSGRYCFEDEKWRTGLTCQYLGILSTIASETSVFILCVLTLLRLHGVFMPLQSQNLKFKYVVIAVITAWSSAFALAFLPVYPGFADTVVEGAWLPSKFFNSTIVSLSSVRKFTDQIGVYVPNSTELLEGGNASWYSMLTYLSMYSPNNQIKGLYGYYSSSSVCISKLFVTSSTNGWIITITIVSINLAVFIFIASSYMAIYRKASSHPQTTVSDRSIKMQKKIIKLIATDFACWVPICMMSLLNFSQVVSMNGTAYAVSAVVLLPINSVLNPLLYSNAFEKL
uniref:G-protein coupled receptors family 1 profile domain-containing protein n=1 Tax=Ciona savignyi TaxID=51511 RepID=H2ZAA3_CIOSA